MKVVKVYGALREQLGQTRFEFVADTPCQAMRALLVNFPHLRQWLLDSEKNGVAYRVMVGKKKIHNDDVSGFFTPWSEKEVFSITPVLTGAGRGFGTVLLGAAFLGLSFISFGSGGLFAGLATPGAAGSGMFGLYAAGAVGSSSLGLIGAGLILQGVAQVISPVPEPPREATRLESNSFSGLVQTNRQGVPVPIAYGRLFVGSAVISVGLDVDEV